MIAVKACGVNFLDGLIVQGKYQTRPPLPFSPGAEVAGVIKEVGPGVAALTPGMRVLAVPGYGGFAQELVTEAAGVMALPPMMDFTTAACFPIVYATSLHALQARAQLRAGETLLVLGGGRWRGTHGGADRQASRSARDRRGLERGEAGALP